MISPTLIFGRRAELIAAVRTLAAVDQAAMLQREQDVLEELLRNRFLLGEIADEHGRARARVASSIMALSPYLPLRVSMNAIKSTNSIEYKARRHAHGAKRLPESPPPRI